LQKYEAGVNLRLAARQMPHFNLSFFHHNQPVTAITYAQFA